MNKLKKLKVYIYPAIALMLGALFVAKFAGSTLLRMYIEFGIGDCKKIPILCMAPQDYLMNPVINKEYIAGLVPYEFPKIKISAPKGFTVVQEMIKKVYYKKGRRPQKGEVIYLLYQEPNFFINLFPPLRKHGISNDYEFIKRTMYAKEKNIKTITDAFFVIMKGIFIPDLGNQNTTVMAELVSGDKKGFINYNFDGPNNYFDCNIINSQGDFFKIYIKDIGATLSLNKVLAIISTVRK